MTTLKEKQEMERRKKQLEEQKKYEKNKYKNLYGSSNKNIYDTLKNDGFSNRDIDNVVDDIEHIWDED